MVDNEYQDLHPDEVSEGHMLRDTQKLDPFVKEYAKLQQQLEDLVDNYSAKKLRGKKIKRKQVCCYSWQSDHWQAWHVTVFVEHEESSIANGTGGLHAAWQASATVVKTRVCS